MGNSDAGLFSGNTFTNGNGTTIGSKIGVGTPLSIARANLPNTSISVTITDPGHTHSYNQPTSFGASGSTFGLQAQATASTTGSSTTGISAAFNLNGNVTQQAINTVSPTILMTIFIKL